MAAIADDALGMDMDADCLFEPPAEPEDDNEDLGLEHDLALIMEEAGDIIPSEVWQRLKILI